MKDLGFKEWAQKVILASKKDLDLKWIQKLYGNHPIIYYFGIGERIFLDLKKVKKIIRTQFPQPLVYYFGMGNVSKMNLELLMPLWGLDFSLLVGVDLARGSFEDFSQASRLLLLALKNLNSGTLKFKEIEKNKFEAEFVFEKKKRKIISYYQFDCCTDFPAEIQSGYQILYTRRGGNLFFKISPLLRAWLLEKNQGMVVFQELIHHEKEYQNWAKKIQSLLKGFERMEFDPYPQKEYQRFGLAERLLVFKKLD